MFPNRKLIFSNKSLERFTLPDSGIIIDVIDYLRITNKEPSAKPLTVTILLFMKTLHSFTINLNRTVTTSRLNDRNSSQSLLLIMESRMVTVNGLAEGSLFVIRR